MRKRLFFYKKKYIS